VCVCEGRGGDDEDDEEQEDDGQEVEACQAAASECLSSFDQQNKMEFMAALREVFESQLDASHAPRTCACVPVSVSVSASFA
jgi:hypothetical protein